MDAAAELLMLSGVRKQTRPGGTGHDFLYAEAHTILRVVAGAVRGSPDDAVSVRRMFKALAIERRDTHSVALYHQELPSERPSARARALRDVLQPLVFHGALADRQRDVQAAARQIAEAFTAYPPNTLRTFFEPDVDAALEHVESALYAALERDEAVSGERMIVVALRSLGHPKPSNLFAPEDMAAGRR